MQLEIVNIVKIADGQIFSLLIILYVIFLHLFFTDSRNVAFCGNARSVQTYLIHFSPRSKTKWKSYLRQNPFLEERSKVLSHFIQISARPYSPKGCPFTILLFPIWSKTCPLSLSSVFDIRSFSILPLYLFHLFLLSSLPLQLRFPKRSCGELVISFCPRLRVGDPYAEQPLGSSKVLIILYPTFQRQ